MTRTKNRTLPALLLALALLAGCAPAQSAPGESTPPPAASHSSASLSVPEPEPEPTVIRLMAAGDAMSHMPITQDAYIAASGEYSYRHMLLDASEQLSGADYAVGNLETPLAGGPDYSGYPVFNAPDSLRGQSYDLVARSGWMDTYQAAAWKDEGITVPGPIDGWQDTPGQDPAGMRLDYIWCSRQLPIRSSQVVFNGINGPIVSDHFGVLAETTG